MVHELFTCTKICCNSRILTVNEFYALILCMPMHSRVYVQKCYVVNDLVDI